MGVVWSFDWPRARVVAAEIDSSRHAETARLRAAEEME
jgi:hypothetical protein